MSADAILSAALLDELDDAWRRQGAPIADSLRPGLSESQIGRITAPLAISLPPEARVWWGWHDGAAPGWPGTAIGPHVTFLTLDGAVEHYKEMRATAAQVGDDVAADEFWDPLWFPLVGSQPDLVCDCRASDAGAPIHAVDFEFPDESRQPAAESFGTVVSWWIGALDAGAWRWEPGREAWSYRPDAMPDFGRPTHGLV